MQKTRLKTLAHMQEKKNMILEGNRPEIIEFCKKVYKTKKLILGAEFLQKCSFSG
jgi:hypothetical protein